MTRNIELVATGPMDTCPRNPGGQHRSAISASTKDGLSVAEQDEDLRRRVEEFERERLEIIEADLADTRW